MPAANEPVIIKKYANRRLYNTETSTYVTLDDLFEMVKEGREFEVVDAKTGSDITRPVLAQIIFEGETKGPALLPVSFLRNVIRFYDHSLQSLVPQYLEMTMDVFTKKQAQFKDNTNKVMGSFSPFNAMTTMQDMQRRNMEMFSRSIGMLNPFLAGEETVEDKDRRIAELTAQVEKLSKEAEKPKKG